MFLNDDQDEASSPWTFAFSTFIGAAVLLGWIGSTFGRTHMKTEPWDPIDPVFQQGAQQRPQARGPPQGQAKGKPGARR